MYLVLLTTHMWQKGHLGRMNLFTLITNIFTQSVISISDAQIMLTNMIVKWHGQATIYLHCFKAVWEGDFNLELCQMDGFLVRCY